MTIWLLMEDSRKKSGKGLVVLARKIISRQRQGVLPKALPRGELLNVAKLTAHFANLKSPGKISRAVVCIDSHSDPAGMARTVAGVQADLASSLDVPAKYVIVVHALETWLLEDCRAVEKVLGIKLGLQKSLELRRSCQADQALRQICDGFNKSVDDERIARRVDVDLVESQNPSFREFVNALRAP